MASVKSLIRVSLGRGIKGIGGKEGHRILNTYGARGSSIISRDGFVIFDIKGATRTIDPYCLVFLREPVNISEFGAGYLMRDEIGMKSKTDVLDFVISFIVEHEKRMDIMTERLERITERLGKKRYVVRNSESPVKIDNPEPGTFTITIHNPEDFEPIKSVRIDWKDTEKIFHPDDLEFDSILHDIEYTLKDDGRD
jgi:hypothetical protein